MRVDHGMGEVILLLLFVSMVILSVYLLVCGD